jgi:quercetin 2,3-dioxygenase
METERVLSSPSSSNLRVLRVPDLMVEDRGWTRGHATCSFDDMPRTAPGFLEYGALRLAALQEVDPGSGYPRHPHAEVETVTILLAGAMSHEDSTGCTMVVGSSGVAVLSAGTGIEHAEMVHGNDAARAMLFWLSPTLRGMEPRFSQRDFDRRARRNRLVALASGRDAEGALELRSPSDVLSAVMDPGATVHHVVAPGRRVYMLTTDGPIDVNGTAVNAGERVLASQKAALTIRALGATEVVIVDLPDLPG